MKEEKPERDEKRKKDKEAVYKHDVARNPGAHWVAYRVSLAGPCYSPCSTIPEALEAEQGERKIRAALIL